jgi:hypothetical protein
MKRNRHKVEKPVTVRVLCLDCHQFFTMPPWMYEELSDPHICDGCVRKDSERLRALLARRGIVFDKQQDGGGR